MNNSRQSNSTKREWKLTDYAIPILFIHAVAIFAFMPSFFTWYNAVLLIVGILVFGQGINLGYHRLLTHRSLVVPKWLEYFYVMLALCCMEETPGKWVSTHRKHHTDSDDADQDPHSPNYGIFWSHMGWLMFKRSGKNSLNIDHRYAGDILSDKFYMFLEKNWWFPLSLAAVQSAVYYVIGLAVFLLMGQSLAEASWKATGVMMWGAILRIVAVWHITWSVNSLSHILGYQNYETGERSRNNWFVALIASGEGWHNNHHHDPASASVQHKWWEFDVTWYHVLFLEKIGLAKNVVRPRHVRQKERLAKKASAETNAEQADGGTNASDDSSSSESAAPVTSQSE